MSFLRLRFLSMRVPTTQPSIRAMTPSSAFTSPYAERIISRIGQPEIIRAQMATTMPRRKEANLPSTHCQRNSPLDTAPMNAPASMPMTVSTGPERADTDISMALWNTVWYSCASISLPWHTRQTPYASGWEKPNITWATTATVAIMMPAVTALILIFFILSFRYLPRSFFSMPFSTLGV